MATKTKKKDPNAPVKQRSAKRPPAVVLAEYEARRAKLIENHEKALATYDAMIIATKKRLDPEAMAEEALGLGLSMAEIEQQEAMFRKARQALKGKTPEEIDAMRAAVAAKKAAKLAEEADA